MVSLSKLAVATVTLLAVSTSVFGDDQIQNGNDNNDARLRKEIRKNPMKFTSPLASNRYTVQTEESVPVPPQLQGAHASKLYREYRANLQEERLNGVKARVEGAGGKDGLHHYGEYNVHKHGHKNYKDHGIYTDSNRDPYDTSNRAGPTEYVDPSYYDNMDSINHDPYYSDIDAIASAGKPAQPVSATESIFWNGYYDVADRGVFNTISDFFAPGSGGKGRAPYWETGGIGNRRRY